MSGMKLVNDDDNDVTPSDSPSAFARQALNAALEARDASRKSCEFSERSCAASEQSRDDAKACLSSQLELAQRVAVIHRQMERLTKTVNKRAHPAILWTAVGALVAIAIAVWVR